LLKLMDRFPIIITLGAALLGWVAGDMATTDPAVKDWVEATAPWLHEAAEVLGAIFVVGVGRMLAAREMASRPVVPTPAPPTVMAPAAASGAGPFRRILLPVDASDA